MYTQPESDSWLQNLANRLQLESTEIQIISITEQVQGFIWAVIETPIGEFTFLV